MKKMLFIYLLILLISATLYAQQSFSFMYNEWPDGCLTMPFGEGHYDYSGRHRNDNAQVRNEIEFFNNWVRQNNATVTREEKQLYLPGVGTRSAEIYTNIILVATSSSSGSSSSSSSSYSPSYSSASSGSSFDGDFLIGYNYSYGFPIGFTIGYSGIYASINLNMSAYFEGVESGGSVPSGLTGKTTENGLEFTIGYSINLIKDRLKLPVGLGMRMTDEYQYYRDNSGNEGWYGSGELEDKSFIVEAGLQLILAKFFYLSSTYRLIGFSKSGFTLGAGFIF